MKKAGPEATRGRAAPKRHTRREMINTFRLKIAERDSLNVTLQGSNQRLEILVERSGEVILQLEDQITTHKQNKTVDQLAANAKKEEHDKLAEHFMKGVQDITTLKIDNVELNRRVKELEDALKDKEEKDNQLIAKQSAKLTKRKIRNSKLKLKVRKLKSQRS